MKEENKLMYQLGMRDMVANLFMEIRESGVDTTLKRYAEMLPDNLHTKHYLLVKNNLYNTKKEANRD